MDSFFKRNFLKKLWFYCSLLMIFQINGQLYEHGSLDMGIGALLSVGLQEEGGINSRLQYTTATKRTAYIAEYNLYITPGMENTRTFSEFMATYNRKLVSWESIDITGGIGYVLNNYAVLASAEDTSRLFFTSGILNHGALLKFRGLYQLSMPIQLFLELNLKSFGKRYDTIAFGLTYSLGL